MNNSPELMLPKRLLAQQRFHRISQVDVPWRLFKDAVDSVWTAVMAHRHRKRGGDLRQDETQRVVTRAIEQVMSAVGGITPELLLALNWRVICFGNILESLKQGFMDTQWLHAHMAQQPTPGGLGWAVTDKFFQALAGARLQFVGGVVAYDLGHLRELLEKVEGEGPTRW